MQADTKPKWKRARGSLLVKMVLFVSILVVVTSGMMNWAGYFVARNIIRNQIRARLQVAASDRHDMILSYVAQQHERVGLVVSRTKLRNLVSQFKKGEIELEPMRDGTRTILADALKSTDGFEAILIADPDGRVLTSTDLDRLDQDLSEHPVFQAGLKGKHLGEPVSIGDKHVILVAAPATSSDGELLGVVMVELNASGLFHILTETEGLGETGEILVGTREADHVRYLFAPEDGSDRITPLDEVPAMASAIGGASRSEVTTYAGQEVLAHYRSIEYQPAAYRSWGLIAKMDTAEAFLPLDDFRRARLWVQAGLVVVGLLGAIWLSRKLTEPIRELTDTATAVAEGNLSAQVAIHGDDEIARLGRTFNVMTRELQSSYATLEDRVRQRTAELQSEIHQREEIQKELQRNAERIQRIIDTANDAFVSMDSRGRIVEWNPQAERMFGWSRDEVLQLEVAETLIPAAHRETHRQGLERFLKTREARVLNQRLELSAVRRDGREFPVEITITPQRLDDDFVFNAFLHDITQRKADELALLEAREAAEAANRSKSEFLANMSHEIRTPMNGIIGMAELLATTQLDQHQRDYLGMVQNSADALLRLLNDILDFSKIEAGKLELESISFSLRECVGNTGHLLATRAAEKRIELACRIAPDIPDVLIGDPGRLRQILVNLVGNAIKFTDEGEVVVNVTELPTDFGSTPSRSHQSAVAEQDQQAASQESDADSLTSESDPATELTRTQRGVVLEISVRDTGIGIPLEKQGLIFEAFGQADASTTRRFGGTGLGLAISTQLVEMMGGSMRLESEPNVGTTFIFTVQFPVADRQELQQPRDLESLQDLRVLVVDDNATNRRIMMEIVESWNMRPVSADSGPEALELIEALRRQGERVPLILLDCMMPQMDGFEFVERLRESVPAEECTIIMVSSAIQMGDSDRCRRLRIARCLAKPVLQSELLNTVLTEVDPGIEATTDVAPVNLETSAAPRRILLVEDGIVNQRVAMGFLERRGHQVVVAQNGQQAVEAAAREPFDLVLMDVQMPVMDGFAATAAIRRSELGSDRHLPIIAMTANAMAGDRERCLAAGMDDYVAKPVESNVLLAAVEAVPAQVLSGMPKAPASSAESGGLSLDSDLAAASQSRNGEPAASLPQSAATSLVPADGSPAGSASSSSQLLDPIDWKLVEGQMPGGTEILRDLAGMLRTEAPKYVEQMKAALAAEDVAQLRRSAHTLKGSVSIFEITRMVEEAERMELLAGKADFDSAAGQLEVIEGQVAELETQLAAFLDAE